MTKKHSKNIIVFDMDETLGHFEQINIFWQIVNNYFENNLNKGVLFNMIDNFNLILRPKIIEILIDLREKKKKKKIDKVILFSNNPSKSWCKIISEFFNYKMRYELFDNVIAAYKYQGKIIEKGRTRYDKSYEDLLNYIEKSKDINICFIDDVFHPYMENENVYYLYIKPYRYSYNFDNMLNIFCLKNSINDKYFKDFVVNEYKKYNYQGDNMSEIDYKIVNLLSKRISEHINKFCKR